MFTELFKKCAPETRWKVELAKYGERLKGAPKYVVIDPQNVKSSWNYQWYDSWWNEDNRRLVVKTVREYGRKYDLALYGMERKENELKVTYVKPKTTRWQIICQDFGDGDALYTVLFPLAEVKYYRNPGEWSGVRTSIKLRVPFCEPIVEWAAKRLGTPYANCFEPCEEGWNEENRQEFLSQARATVDPYNYDIISMQNEEEEIVVKCVHRRTGEDKNVSFYAKRLNPVDQEATGVTREILGHEELTPDTAFPWGESKTNSMGYPIYSVGNGKFVSQDFINKYFPYDETRKNAKCYLETLNDGSLCLTTMDNRGANKAEPEGTDVWMRYAIESETANAGQECTDFVLKKTGEWIPKEHGISFEECEKLAAKSLDRIGCAMTKRLEKKHFVYGGPVVFVAETIDKYTGKKWEPVYFNMKGPFDCGSFGVKYVFDNYCRFSKQVYDMWTRYGGPRTPEERHQMALREAAEVKETPVVEENTTEKADPKTCKWWFDLHYADLEELEANINENRYFTIPASMMVGVSSDAVVSALSNVAYKYDVISRADDGSICVHVAIPITDADIEFAENYGNGSF